MKTNKAFTLIELLIVMAVIAILIAIAIPSFRGMQNEASKTKAQGDVRVIKEAIESYYKNNSNMYPVIANYQALLMGASPQILDHNLYDPFVSGGSTPYVYALSSATPAQSNYYIVYSVGVSGTGSCNVNNTTGQISIQGDAVYDTNGHP